MWREKCDNNRKTFNSVASENKRVSFDDDDNDDDHVDGVRIRLSTTVNNGPIVYPAGDICT
jgi:hypothetical protein